MKSGYDLSRLIKFTLREDWRDALEDAMAEHVGLAQEEFGVEFEEIGALLGNSRPTSQRDFQAARAWLLSAMNDAEGPAGSVAVRHPIGRSGRE